LCPYERHEEKAHVLEDGERPQQQYQQKSSSWELLK